MLYNINHFTISEAAVDLEIHWQNCKIVDHNRDCKIVDRNEVDRNDRYDRAPHLDYHLWYEVGFDGHWKLNILEYSFYDYIKFCEKGGFFSSLWGYFPGITKLLKIKSTFWSKQSLFGVPKYFTTS